MTEASRVNHKNSMKKYKSTTQRYVNLRKSQIWNKMCKLYVMTA